MPARPENRKFHPARLMPNRLHCTSSQRTSGAFMIASSGSPPASTGLEQAVRPSHQPYSTPAWNAPIDPEAKFVVATNNYRAGGGGKFPEIDASKVIFEAPDTNRDVIDGVTYRIDLSQPPKYGSKGEVLNAASNRIVELAFDGKPIDPAQRFVVASNNYRAGGGGNFPEINASKVIFEAPDTNRDVIVRYIVEQGTINPSADANWSFAPVEGATAVFETGPKAKDFIGDVKGVTIEPAGEGAEGFAKYRITL